MELMIITKKRIIIFSQLLIIFLLCLLVACTTASSSSSDNGTQEEATTPPSAPSSLVATAHNKRVNLSWDAVSSATKYNLYWKTSSGVTIENGTKIGDITTTSYAHSGLTNSATYYYALTAENSKGESTISSEASATPILDWTITTLISSGAAGRFCSLALDSKDKVHIAHYVTNVAIKYISNASGSWVEETIDTVGIAESLSIAIDSNDGLHVSYYSTSGYDLKYAYKASGSSSWVKATIDSTGTVGQYNAIAVDNNNVHIAYGDLTNGSLKYATNAIGATDSWDVEIVDGNASGQVHASICAQSDGTVHIAYREQASTIKYVTGSKASWSTPVTVDSGGVIYDTDIALDSSDKVHISYYLGGLINIKYATNATGSWQAQELSAYSGSSGKHTSIALDSEDNVYISYYKESSSYSAVKIVTKYNGSWESSSTIEEDGDDDENGKYTSIAIDSNDKVHVSYYKGNGADLKYAVDK
jgi:hypothetical protein